MIRTQVYLTPLQYQRIKIVSMKEKKKPAEVIRQLLDKGLVEQKKPTIGEALNELAELGKRLNLKGPKDLSSNIDKYLYEDD